MIVSETLISGGFEGMQEKKKRKGINQKDANQISIMYICMLYYSSSETKIK